MDSDKKPARAEKDPELRVGSVALEALFEAAPDGIVIVDAEGRIRAVNRKLESLFGYSRAELHGESIDTLVPESMRRTHSKHRASYRTTPVNRQIGNGLELSGRRCDGTEFPVEISLNAVAQDEEQLVIAIVRDLTDRKRLQSFGVQALRAMEAERQRIALELHDDTLQVMSALLLRLRMVQRQLGPGASSLDGFRDQLVEAAEGIRRIAGALRPPELDTLGLGPAVRAHARNLTAATGHRITVEADVAPESLSPDTQLAVYRIVQEAVSNSLKHAPNSVVQVSLAERDGAVVATVEDSGDGFDVEAALTRRRGLGLFSMLERAEHAGGRVELSSELGTGTRIVAVFPFEPEVGDG